MEGICSTEICAKMLRFVQKGETGHGCRSGRSRVSLLIREIRFAKVKSSPADKQPLRS